MDATAVTACPIAPTRSTTRPSPRSPSGIDTHRTKIQRGVANILPGGGESRLYGIPYFGFYCIFINKFFEILTSRVLFHPPPPLPPPSLPLRASMSSGCVTSPTWASASSATLKTSPFRSRRCGPDKPEMSTMSSQVYNVLTLG
jgi:hypothetical protein